MGAWTYAREKEYPVDIEVSAFDRPGILNEVMHIVSETKQIF